MSCLDGRSRSGKWKRKREKERKNIRKSADGKKDGWLSICLRVYTRI